MLSLAKSQPLSTRDSLTGTTTPVFYPTKAMSMFLPMPTFTTLSLLITMIIPLLVTLVFSKLANSLPQSFGGWASPLTFTAMSMDAHPVSSIKSIHIRCNPPSVPFHPCAPAPFSRSPATSSPTFPFLAVLILFWSWSTMGLLRG